MKKLGSILICIILMLSMVTMSASAADKEGVLTLPENDGTAYPVTGISDSYSYDEEVYRVIVPENIVRLGDQAFYSCTNLYQIKLHDKIQRIGKQAFEKTEIYEDADNWSDGVLYIGDTLIKADPNVISESYQIKAGTRLIADGAFENCENLAAIELPDTVEYIGADAFSGTSLMNNKVNWANNALIIDHVLIAVDKEYNGVFSVPDGIRTIADCAFEHAKVTEVTTPDTLRYIGHNAFWDCQELVSISLGESVETLGCGPFRMCNKLETITVHEDNENFAVSDGVLYNHHLSSVVKCPQMIQGRVVLPYTIKKINAYAFEWCTEMESIEIPEGCVFIGNSAFSTCENLSDVVLPETLEYIDTSAFSYCNSIESISIPDNVYYLGKYAFNCCLNLKEVEIGDGIDELKYCLFESCEKLNKVTLGDNIRVIDDTAFLFTRYVSNVSNYQNGLLVSSDRYLIKVAHDVTYCYIPNGIAIIADGAFEYPSEEGCLSEVHVPSSIERMNWGAFHEVSETTPIYFSGSIERFINITNFDWDCINLYTSDFNSSVWSVIILTGCLIVMIAGVVVLSRIKRKQILRAEAEEEHGES